MANRKFISIIMVLTTVVAGAFFVWWFYTLVFQNIPNSTAKVSVPKIKEDIYNRIVGDSDAANSLPLDTADFGRENPFSPR